MWSLWQSGTQGSQFSNSPALESFPLCDKISLWDIYWRSNFSQFLTHARRVSRDMFMDFSSVSTFKHMKVQCISIRLMLTVFSFLTQYERKTVSWKHVLPLQGYCSKRAGCVLERMGKTLVKKNYYEIKPLVNAGIHCIHFRRMLWQLLHIEINNPFAVKNSVQSYFLQARKGIKINDEQNWHQL